VRIDFGEWTPDRPPLVNQRTLKTCKNVLPIVGGYGPQSGLATVSGFSALAERARGAISIKDAFGNPATYVGTETKLYCLGAQDATGEGLVDVTRTSGAYNASDDARWEFALFGNILIAVNPNDDTQYINVSTGTNFAALRGDAADAPAGSVGIAPRAKHVGLVGNHIVLGNTNDPIFGPVPDSVWWPQIRNPFNWPTTGTDDAVAAQSDRQPLEGNAGGVQRILAGAEVGVIFQERAIHRMDYIGGDVIFQITRVEPNRGLLASGLAVAIGRFVYFCNEDGWYVSDYTSSTPIGRGKMDTFFFNDLDQANIERCSTVRDPDKQRFYVLYPGAGNTGGTPNRFLCYDWALEQWTHGEFDPTGAGTEILVENGAFTAQPSLDYPQAGDPGIAEDPDAVDTPAGLPSFDEETVVVGAEVLSAFDSSNQLAQFTGAALEATFETGDIEIDPGWWTVVSEVRPLVTGSRIPIVSVAALEKARETNDPLYGPAEPMDEDGNCAVDMGNGRYHRFKLSIPAGGFDEVVGIEIDEYTRSGLR
jgi:hypothetical protein